MFFKKKDKVLIETPEKKKGRFSLITGIVVGGAVGSVISLLFAPDKGVQTRKKVSKKGKELYAKGKTKAELFLEKYNKAVKDEIKKDSF